MILGIRAMELRDLVISLIALIIAFSVLFGGRQLDTDMILISTLGVASGFLLHELAHKFTAMHDFSRVRLVAPGAGLEPATRALTVPCSAN